VRTVLGAWRHATQTAVVSVCWQGRCGVVGVLRTPSATALPRCSRLVPPRRRRREEEEGESPFVPRGDGHSLPRQRHLGNDTSATTPRQRHLGNNGSHTGYNSSPREAPGRDGGARSGGQTRTRVSAVLVPGRVQLLLLLLLISPSSSSLPLLLSPSRSSLPLSTLSLPLPLPFLLLEERGREREERESRREGRGRKNE